MKIGAIAMDFLSFNNLTILENKKEILKEKNIFFWVNNNF